MKNKDPHSALSAVTSHPVPSSDTDAMLSGFRASCMDAFRSAFGHHAEDVRLSDAVAAAERIGAVLSRTGLGGLSGELHSDVCAEGRIADGVPFSVSDLSVLSGEKTVFRGWAVLFQPGFRVSAPILVTEREAKPVLTGGTDADRETVLNSCFPDQMAYLGSFLQCYAAQTTEFSSAFIDGTGLLLAKTGCGFFDPPRIPRFFKGRALRRQAESRAIGMEELAQTVCVVLESLS